MISEKVIVRILNVLMFIAAAFGIIGGVYLLLGSFCVINLPWFKASGWCFDGFVPSLVILLVSAGILIVGIELWKFRNWARIATSVLLIIFCLYNFGKTILNIKSNYLIGYNLIIYIILFILSLYLLLYLLLNKKAKKLFMK